jgi:hypothetical protein
MDSIALMSEVLVGGRVCGVAIAGAAIMAIGQKPPRRRGPGRRCPPASRTARLFQFADGIQRNSNRLLLLNVPVPANHERQRLRFALPSRRVATRMQKS